MQCLASALGSKTDLKQRMFDVRFSVNSGHSQSDSNVSFVPGTEMRHGGSRPLKCPQWVVGERTSAKGAAVLDRIELFQFGVAAFASGRRATKILEVHSSTVS